MDNIGLRELVTAKFAVKAPYENNSEFFEDALLLVYIRIIAYWSAAFEPLDGGGYRFRGCVTRIEDIPLFYSEAFRLTKGYAEWAGLAETFWEHIRCRLCAAVPFAAIMESYKLCGFEAHCVLLALTPEIDSSYERVYGLLQDDLSLYQPGLWLAERLYARPMEKPAYLFDDHGLFERMETDKRSGMSRSLKLKQEILGFLLSDGDVVLPETSKFSGLARSVEYSYSWDDLILPPETKQRLATACRHVLLAETVYERWGFGRKAGAGRGVSMLFAGPPGTGKTMAASILASKLGRELYKIDFPLVVSKYIGETEKNLKRIFDEAKESDAVLLFDEADALFGKRTEIKDAHDRNANLEVAYLLQRMDEFDGVLILTTNFQNNIDEAFKRRLGFIIEFPWPDRECRMLLWRAALPPEAPQKPNIDWETLAGIELSGSSIRNTAVGAAFRAAAEQDSIGMEHITEALAEELSKSGKTFPRDNLFLM